MFFNKDVKLLYFSNSFITKKILIHNNVVTNKRLSTDKVFLFSSLISIFLFSLLSNILYGEIILNPQKIYGTNITASSLISSESGLLQEFISLLKTFFYNYVFI